MKIQLLNITCSKCKHKPKVKKLDNLYYLECGCTKSAGWAEIHNAISSWIIEIGVKGKFDWITKIIGE